MKFTMTLPVLLVIVVILCLNALAVSWNLNRYSIPKGIQHGKAKIVKQSVSALLGAIALSTLNGGNACAVQGAIKASSLSEVKASVVQIQQCLNKIKEMQASPDDFAAMAQTLSTDIFSSFDVATNALVRCEYLTAEDKIALGTIKRYGLVADALIMLGGLSSELRSGGFKIKGGDGLQQAIEDTEEEDEDNVKVVDKAEVKRFLKLSRGALEDILRIVEPVMQKTA